MARIPLLLLASVAVLAVAATACREHDALPTGPTTAPPTTAPPTSGAPARPVTPLAAGDHVRTVRTADGRDRTYRVHVPAGLGDAPVAVVVGLHGGTGNGAQFARASGLDAVADARGFVAVEPDGIGSVLGADVRTWNAGLCCGAAAREGVDDIAFLRTMLDELAGLVRVDQRRIHLIGHSNGAMLAYRAICELGDRVASVGLQAGNLQVSPCAPAAPVSLLHLHGTADTNVPIEGGVGSGIAGVAFPPVSTGLAAVVAANGCDPTPARTVDAANPDVVTTTWSGGRGGSEVRFVQVAGATHAWMGRAAAAAALTGPPYTKLDATAVLVDFVLAHPRA